MSPVLIAQRIHISLCVYRCVGICGQYGTCVTEEVTHIVYGKIPRIWKCVLIERGCRSNWRVIICMVAVVWEWVSGHIEGPIAVTTEVVVPLPRAGLPNNAVGANSREIACNKFVVLINTRCGGVRIWVLSLVVVAVGALQELHESLALGVGVLNHESCCWPSSLVWL